MALLGAQEATFYSKSRKDGKNHLPVDGFYPSTSRWMLSMYCFFCWLDVFKPPDSRCFFHFHVARTFKVATTYNVASTYDIASNYKVSSNYEVARTYVVAGS